MAIKGKRKGKARSGRVVTPGPRPSYVPPRIPPLARPGAKFLLALVLEAIVFALVVGFAEQSQADRQEEAVTEFTSLVEAALSQGDAIQRLPTSFLILPQLSARLAEIEGGEVADTDAIVSQAEGWATATTDAASAIRAISIPEDRLDPDQRLALTDARNLMERGLVLFGGVATQTGIAVELEGEQRGQLIETIRQQGEVATTVFNAGYGKLQRVRELLGLSTVTEIPGGGFPGGIPGGVPGIDQPVQELPIEIDEGEGGGGQSGGDGGEGGGGGGNG